MNSIINKIVEGLENEFIKRDNEYFKQRCICINLKGNFYSRLIANEKDTFSEENDDNLRNMKDYINYDYVNYYNEVMSINYKPYWEFTDIYHMRIEVIISVKDNLILENLYRHLSLDRKERWLYEDFTEINDNFSVWSYDTAEPYWWFNGPHEKAMFNTLTKINGHIHYSNQLKAFYHINKLKLEKYSIDTEIPKKLDKNNYWFSGVFDGSGFIEIIEKELVIGVYDIPSYEDSQLFIKLFGGEIEHQNNNLFKWQVKTGKEILEIFKYFSKCPPFSYKSNRLLLVKEYYKVKEGEGEWMEFMEKWDQFSYEISYIKKKSYLPEKKLKKNIKFDYKELDIKLNEIANSLIDYNKMFKNLFQYYVNLKGNIVLENNNFISLNDKIVITIEKENKLIFDNMKIWLTKEKFSWNQIENEHYYFIEVLYLQKIIDYINTFSFYGKFKKLYNLICFQVNRSFYFSTQNLYELNNDNDILSKLFDVTGFIEIIENKLVIGVKDIPSKEDCEIIIEWYGGNMLYQKDNHLFRWQITKKEEIKNILNYFCYYPPMSEKNKKLPLILEYYEIIENKKSIKVFLENWNKKH